MICERTRLWLFYSEAVFTMLSKNIGYMRFLFLSWRKLYFCFERMKTVSFDEIATESVKNLDLFLCVFYSLHLKKINLNSYYPPPTQAISKNSQPDPLPKI